MEKLNETPIIEFNPNTLIDVRKVFDLDKPERINTAVTLLDEWVKKQEHFNKKDLDKSFLEKILIMNKGRIERAKIKVDKLFTIRTLMPEFFGAYSFKDDPEDMVLSVDAVLPKLTPDNYRVFISRRTKSKLTDDNFVNYVRRLVSSLFYEINHDYCVGQIIVIDHMDLSITDLIGQLDLEKFRQAVSIVVEGFATRVKQIHILSQSQLIDMLVALVKPVIPKKFSERISIHNSMESLSNVLPKEILPVEYGGTEKPFMELYENLINELSSEDHLDYMKKICEVTVDESRRTTGKFNEDYLGIPGSFRTLNVD